MLTTLKDLCATFPKVSIHQSPLDNVAAKLFKPDGDMPYIYSVSVPEKRYGIPVDHALLRHHNDIVPNFHDYGPNEQYLINKVIFSPSNLLYVIGGIGVGKTRFAHFLMDEILPQIISQDEKLEKYGPCTIYYDFLDAGNALPSHEDSTSVRAAFLDTFCDRVEAELYSHNFFDLEYEVGTIWDSIIEENRRNYKKHIALSFIISELRVSEAEHTHLAKDYAETVQKRKIIRQKIRGNQARRISYLALLLRYVRQHYFDSNPAGLVVIIDNVDREPSLVQQEVKLIIKPFARVSGGRTIINARQTTYYQQFDDGSSEPIDVVPYCGPEPLDILKARIDDFLKDHTGYDECYDPEYLPHLVKGIQRIRGRHISNEAFRDLFTSLCGRSVRKGLVLAQNIVNNSVYDPSTTRGTRRTENQAGSHIGIGDVLRALLVGTDDIFKTNPGNIIDNVFNVEPYPGKSYLLKLRILKLVQYAGDRGVTINRMIDIMSGFGYTMPMICDAVNELKSLKKRLVWSDAVRMKFRDEKDLVNHGPTLLHVSTAGQGYTENLFSNINYVQEVMLDTQVEASIFGSGWKYHILEDRFELVLKFLTLLSNFDKNEVTSFVSMKGADEYTSAFGDVDLLTKQMFTGVKRRLERILSSVVDSQHHGEKKERFRDFRAKHLGIYEDRITLVSGKSEWSFGEIVAK